MKDFITTIASLMLLMIFLLQFVTNQSIYTKMAGAEYAVREFRITAEENKELSDAQIRRLKECTAGLMGCTAEEVQVTVNEMTELSPAGGGDSDEGKDKEVNESETFSYEIKMPLKGLIAAADFLGISAEENQTVYSSKGLIRIRADEAEEKDEEKAEEREDSDTSDDDSVNDDASEGTKTETEKESASDGDKEGDSEKSSQQAGNTTDEKFDNNAWIDNIV